MLLLTAEEMRAIDRRTIEGGHATGIELMRRAGRGVVDAIEGRYGSLLGLRALVLCGTGNNGGDGFVAAAEMRDRGAAVRVVVLGQPGRIQGDAALAMAELSGPGIEVATATTEPELATIIRELDEWDLGVDALLGTGARGVPEGAIAAGVQALRELDDAGTRIVAIDLPTGVDADTGAIARRAVRADFTVTFGSPKRGHYLYPGRAFSGELEVVDIGLVSPPAGDPIGAVRLSTAAAMAALLPLRDPRAHKGMAGRVLVIGGSPGLTGAVALAARAASRAGAGYVQVAIPASLHDVMAAKLTEQMPIRCAESPERSLVPASWESIAAHLDRIDAVALGPGLSRDPGSLELARRAVAEVAKPMVIDADALRAVAGAVQLLAHARAPRVLTPHLGEMSRLTGLTTETLEARRIDAPREWADTWNTVVLMKGAPTVIASPQGGTHVNPTGNPGMATAGMGDVLTGVVAALLAQGLDAHGAAALAAYLHGAAGDHVAAERGLIGLVAGDVVESMPAAIHALGGRRVEPGGR